MIVSAWNPDEGWERDALLRVNATKGIPTLDLTVWELVDVMVHPLGVHIVQHVANNLWVRSLVAAKTIAANDRLSGIGMSTYNARLNACIICSLVSALEPA